MAWFNRVCAALERPAEASFRDTMARLCPDLLTGFFNHDARQEVGLPQTWCAPPPPPQHAHSLLADARIASWLVTATCYG